MSARRTNRVPVAAGAKRQRRARRWVPEEPRPPLDHKEARRLYEKEGLTVLEISRRLGYAYGTTHGAIRGMGLKPRPHVTKRGKWVRLLHRRWKLMRSKCRRRRDPSFAHYGGRGVGICAEWEGFPAFHAWALASGFRPGLDLALIDRRHDFSPRNCRWQTRSETIRRTLREGRGRQPRIRAFGETKNLFAWSEDPRCKVSFVVLKTRLLGGHSPEAALTTPSGDIKGLPRRRVPVLKSNPRAPRREIDWKAAERRLLSERVSVARLARELGVTPDTVHRHLAKAKERLRREASPPPAPEVEDLRKRWRHLLHKFDDPAHPLYPWFGRKKISLHRPWRQFEAFRAWAEASGYRPGLWLTRVDQRKGFEPANCRWMPPSEAMQQPKFEYRRASPRNPLEAFGESKSPYAWSHDRRCAVSVNTLRRRLRAGWNPEDALTASAQNGSRPPRVLVTAFGQTKSLAEWTRDPRCQIHIGGLRKRLGRGIPAEVAITAPGFQLPPPAELPRARARHRK